MHHICTVRLTKTTSKLSCRCATVNLIVQLKQSDLVDSRSAVDLPLKKPYDGTTKMNETFGATRALGLGNTCVCVPVCHVLYFEYNTYVA